MASALDFADRQLSEFAALQPLELDQFPGHIELEIRGGSASRPGEWVEGSMLLPVSLLLPAGAGAVTTSVVDL